MPWSCNNIPICNETNMSQSHSDWKIVYLHNYYIQLFNNNLIIITLLLLLLSEWFWNECRKTKKQSNYLITWLTFDTQLKTEANDSNSNNNNSSSTINDCDISTIIIYMKKLLDSDWLRAVQFKCNTSAKSVTPMEKVAERLWEIS